LRSGSAVKCMSPRRGKRRAPGSAEETGGSGSKNQGEGSTCRRWAADPAPPVAMAP
jgi:hypothetical protein